MSHLEHQNLNEHKELENVYFLLIGGKLKYFWKTFLERLRYSSKYSIIE